MTDAATRDFSATLQLPKTDFPMRANLPGREPEWVSDWLKKDIYGKLRAKRQAEGAPVFIVHLGPPYANGNFHMGHVLTYVLKDFVVRSKFLAGFDSPYAPGWDCHGLPIEWKVEQDELRAKGKSKHDVSRQQLRAWCRDYAAKWVGVQKAEWQRFGAMGDWERPYLTMAPANEAGIVRELGKLVRRGLVYRGLRSTQWSWAEETAMAEAEVEYKDVTSTAVYVALPLVGSDESVVIWTTTPWTLPANRAVAVKADEPYELVDFNGRKLWVAATLRESLQAVLGGVLTVAKRCNGDALVSQRVAHPLFDGVNGPVVDGFHVTTDAGTGLVHIAPAHGVEDFRIGQEVGLDLACPVKGDGTYENDVPALPLTGVPLAGKLIWKAQKDILDELRANGRLLHAADFQHSYPVSWRSKEKLIYRSTEQWFVGMDIPVKGLIAERSDEAVTLRAGSLARIFGKDGGKDGVHGVQWVPGYGANRIGSMIEGRPDWCISRQRAWGVPITIMTDKRTGLPVADEAVWEHIAALVEQEGIDAWDNRLGGREAELFPHGWLAAQGATAADFTYATDILDVWFDSGTSHAHVLRAESGPGQRFHRTDGKRPADLYQEGSDQHRGWFHSSLLTSVAAYGDAPYEAVVTSGFVVDGEGRKFSKSLKNGVEPGELLPKYGMDIIRLWVASSDYSEDIRYSPQIMDGTAEAYRKFRNTLRWLLGNLDGFDAAADSVPYADMPELEQYLLHRLHAVATEVRAYFDAYQFHKAYRVLNEFCTVDLSNFYFDVRKDALYCDAAGAPRRRACQTVLEQVFRVLATHLAPLACFTADEAWKSRYGADACVHLERFAEVEAAWARDERFAQRWAAILGIRDMVNATLEAVRSAGEIKGNLEADVAVALPEGDLVLRSEADDALLAEVCGVSGYASRSVPTVDKMRAEAGRHSGHKCPRCWRYYGQLADSGVCLRCEEAVQTMTTKAA